MDVFDWVHERIEEYAEKGDLERFDLTQVRDRHYKLRETDVDAYLQVLHGAAHQARLLDEPYWALYYDAFYLEALTRHKKDFRDALDLAAKCVLEVRKPMFRSWPGRFVIYNTAAHVYTGVDPWGYASAIQDLLDSLDKEVPPEPNHDRMVASLRRITFLEELERWDEARQACFGLYPQAEEFGSIGYCYAIQSDLSYIEYFRGNWENLFPFPYLLEQLTEGGHAYKMDLAESLAWRAAASRRRGNEEMAQKRYRSAESRIVRLTAPPTSEYFQAIVAFHEAVADWEKALAVRERELEIVAPTGQTHYECKLRIDRCRLLRKLGRPTSEAAEHAKVPTTRLRTPDYALAKLEMVLSD